MEKNHGRGSAAGDHLMGQYAEPSWESADDQKLVDYPDPRCISGDTFDVSDEHRKLSEKICKPKGKQPVNFTEKPLKHANPSSAKLGRGGMLVIESDRIASEFQKHRNSDSP